VQPRQQRQGWRRLQQALVDSVKATGYLRRPAVETAFRAIPCYLFLPGAPLEDLAIMAVMPEQLEIQPGQHVLEFGVGTGYNAALRSQLVGDSGQLVSVHIDADLLDQARRNLAREGLGRVHVVCGYGRLGYPDATRYDRIILTVGAWDIAPARWEQLRADGRLVLPLSICEPESHKSIAFELADDHLVSAVRQVS
jgi:protein-L-isoaspartate(D-aspartate) O-methyltransferase